ncbi:hypothetical protein Taro_036882, partial [Colocasia esculenta]|nr:hypothetical protein [Colocasia esculenta]
FWTSAASPDRQSPPFISSSGLLYKHRPSPLTENPTCNSHALSRSPLLLLHGRLLVVPLELGFQGASALRTPGLHVCPSGVNKIFVP